jgi:hypothetical protein
MKKLRITWLCLILAGILLGISSCSNDAEELQGKLVITFAKPTKGLKVAICSMENTKYPILVESPNINGVLKVSLNIGNYYIKPSDDSSDMYSDIGIQVRPDKTTTVTYGESRQVIGRE